jgi:hypothetical protein
MLQMAQAVDLFQKVHGGRISGDVRITQFERLAEKHTERRSMPS